MKQEMPRFDQKKFEVVVHYIIEQCGARPNFGKTVLYKLLYFADFDYYEQTRRFLTGETYMKITYGPAPRHIDKTLSQLLKEEKIKSFKGKAGKFDQQKFVALSSADLNLLSGEEKKVIDSVISRYGQRNAADIKTVSHKDIPVEATEKNKEIDYDLVFYREPPFAMISHEEPEEENE